MKDSVKSDRGFLPAETAPPNGLSFGPFRVDVVRRRLWRDEQLVPLTQKAFDTLLALLRQAGQIVERDDLLRTVWPDTFVTEETLTQNIATIRRALADSSERPVYIATIPRRGYKFVGIVKPERAEGTPVTTDASAVEPSPVRPFAGPTRRTRLVVGAALTTMVFSVGLGVAYYLRRPPPELPFGGEWQINPPAGTTLMSAGVLSPDARSIAFVTIDGLGETALWVQKLGSLDPLRLPETDNARAPFWSADGRTIAFTADGKLKRIGLADKAPQTLADVSLPQLGDHGGAWSPPGVLLLPTDGGPLYKLEANGRFTPATRLEAGERIHLWPSFLPDGRHFLFRAAAFEPDRSATYVGSVDSPIQRTLLDGVGSAAVYAPPGYLLFVREGELVAQRFDAEQRKLQGAPVLVAPGVAPPHTEHGLTFSASGGVVSYLSGRAHNELAWFDHHGLRLGALDGSAGWIHPVLSPDDAQVLAGRPRTDMGTEIWVAPTTSGTASRLETGLPQSGLALWSRDARRIAFTSAGDLCWVSAGGGQAHVLLKAPARDQPLLLQDWSRDGRFLVYFTPGAKTGMDLWVFSIAEQVAAPLLRGPGNEEQAQLSPDGHWIAYASDETGRFEVYVQRFPNDGNKQKASVSGGAQPQWSPNGGELFYLSLEHDLMSVEFHPGWTPRLGTPQRLFHVTLYQRLLEHRNSYAVGHDGNRFLVSAGPSSPPPITVRLNWTAALDGSIEPTVVPPR